ncbi:guanine nucleotide exchange protein SMCR8-like isoform X2 [Liolophura sinensis]|uniref:guanine nucleotide exchange protein SMCR8-like isoform X2 n=1 Tax=Liolophura sinensis TaxID=3198878 RepID=UPI003158AE68
MLNESQWYTQVERGGQMEYFGDVLSPYLFPDYAQQHPWNKASTCDKDFILISEFCEQEGPKPLITIPTDEGSDFDKNEFVVRIMAVDHQASSGGFTMSEDTQVVMTELKNGTYAYVHHFTLFDHQARGFVRPFCMTYVTADPRKLMSFFEDLCSEFNKVSRYFKYGNKIVFVKDLANHLKDLQYTRDRVVEVQAQLAEKGEVTLDADERFLRDFTLESVDQAIQEVKDILRQVQPQLNDKRLEERFKRLEQKAMSSRHQKMTDLFESISLRGESDTVSPHKPTRSSGSFTYSGSYEMGESFLHQNPNHKVKLVRLGRRRFEEALRGLHELCQWGAKEGLNRLRSIHKYFSRDCAILEIEKNESTLIDPHCSLLTLGRCVAANFLHDIDIQCAGAFWSLGMGNRDQRLLHPTSNLLRRWLSNDTLDSYKSLDSFLSVQDEEGMMSAKSSYEPAFVMASARVEESGIKGNGHCDLVDNHSVNSWVDIPYPVCDTLTEQPDIPGVKSEIPGTQADMTATIHDIRGTKSDDIDIKSHINGTKWDITETTCKPDIAGDNVRMSIGDIPGEKSEIKMENSHIDDGPDFDSTKGNKTVLPAVDISNVLSFDGRISDDAMTTNGQARKSESPSSAMLESAMSCCMSDTRMTTSDSGMDSEAPTPSDIGAEFRIPDSKDRGKAWDVSFSDIHADSGISTMKTEDQKARSSFDNESESSGQTLTDSQGELQLNGVCVSEMNRLRKSTDSGIEGESKLELSPGVQEMERTCTVLQVGDQLTCDEVQTLAAWPGSVVDGTSQDSASDIDDTATLPSDSVRKIKVAVFSAADHVCRMSSASPGHKLLKICQLYSHLHSVIYSLLSGRTVVILGSVKMEREVREIVTALELFLPGYSSTFESVIPLYHKPLRLPEVIKYKLIGLCRPEKRSLDYMVPNSVKHYLTILDVEKRYIMSPLYQGHYVNLLLNHVSHFKSEESFIAYLHSVLLEIASEAFVYYHLFCLSSSGNKSRGSTPTVQYENYRKSSSATCRKLGLQDCDARIVEYLVELIKRQQVEEFFTKMNLEPEFTAPTLRHSTESSQIFKC